MEDTRVLVIDDDEDLIAILDYLLHLDQAADATAAPTENCQPGDASNPAVEEAVGD